MEALILPKDDAVNTSDNLDGLEIVSFLETLNLASPYIFPASGE